MGKKKTLREVLLRHPELFDLVQALSKDDSLVAEETESNGQPQVILTREGKKKIKATFTFTKTAEGYLFQTLASDAEEPATDA